MAEPAANPLVSTKPSDLDLTVSLHPLVLLTASDQITRHRVRGGKGPIAGILLGQQKGREVTAEHAFAAAFDKNEAGQDVFREDWLEQRIQQYRDVHKAPALDAVGWFTLCSAAGPRPEFVPLQLQLNSINESAILLAIHPEAFEATGQAVNQKLPISIYESFLESDAAAAANANDESSMQVDGDEPPSHPAQLKFRSVPYTVETDEAEMIAINYVAKGAGSAAAVAEQQQSLTNNNSKKKTGVNTPPEPADTVSPAAQEEGGGSSDAAAAIASSKKGKKRATSSPPRDPSSRDNQEASSEAVDLGIPTTEEQDTISTIQTRLNSVKMLQTRIELLRKFVTSLPPSYLSDASIPLTAESPSPAHLVHLRSIQALITRLSLLTTSSEAEVEATTTAAETTAQPTAKPKTTSLEAAAQAQANDVALTQLLSTLTHDVQALSELGKKFSVVDSARNARKKGGGAAGGPGSGGGAAAGQGWGASYHHHGGLSLDDVDLRKMPYGGAGSSMVL